MRAPRQYELVALIPIAAGLLWLLAGQGFVYFLTSLVPGVLLVASGCSALFWPGEAKISQYMAFGAVLGVVLSPIAALLIGLSMAVLLALVSAATFLCAGRIAIAYAEPSEAPAPPADNSIYAKAALDEALVGYFVTVAQVPSGALAERMCRDVTRLEQILEARNAFVDPSVLHPAPAAPEESQLIAARGVGLNYQRLSYASAFVADPELPGSELWAGYSGNQKSVASLFRHAESGRPWLLCIHGYRMGTPMLDLRLFPPALLHQRYKLNLLMPTLPLHGPRRCGLQSGDRFLDGNLLDLLLAEMQTLWDLRRAVAWIRSVDPGARIGVLGYSLGGYNAALLAAYEPGLDFVVAGIPVCDLASALWGHIPAQNRRYFAAQGLDQDRYRRLLHPVSPEALAPKLAAERLHIFAGTADRIVPPLHPLRLARHWQRPVQWYAGGHLTFRGERVVTRCLEDAMNGAGWPLAGSA